MRGLSNHSLRQIIPNYIELQYLEAVSKMVGGITLLVATFS